MNWTILKKAIQTHDIITIFSHVNPDTDALGSSYGLKQLILDNYNGKQVLILGEGEHRLFNDFDIISYEIVANSLAIILDTPTLARVSSKQVSLTSTSILVDHHPLLEPFTNEIFQSIEYGSTCEMIADFIQDTGLNLSKECAAFLYMGMLTDTLSFKTNNTSYKTLEKAAFLAKSGFDIAELNRTLFDIELNKFQFKANLSTKLTINNSFGYAILSKNDYQPYGMSESDAKGFVNTFGSIKGLNIWALFILNEETNLYEGSLRSKYAALNSIAQSFNGGGHKNASGVKLMSKQDLSCLINQLSELSID